MNTSRAGTHKWACACAAIVLLLLNEPAAAWSLKTHVWIAQQVLNDAQDGSLTIKGRNYALPAHVLDALRNHPDRYRMGSLGPDVFPDPIVGQTTTHPGVKGGWQTDQWLRHMLSSAQSPEQIAFAYGFAAHAAGDIFAHTYVNAYAGGIFELIDSEREIELRHFVLEKYIESATPHPVDHNGAALNLNTALGTPAAFLRDTLILGGNVSSQNARAKTGFHLTAMHEVRHAVTELQKGTQDVIGTLTRWGAKYFQQKLQLEIDLATGRTAVEAAKVAIRVEEEVLNVKRRAYQEALGVLDRANGIIQRHPELITHNQHLLAIQINTAADAAATATRIAAEAAGAINDIQNRIGGWLHRLGQLSCDSWLSWVPLCDELNDAISEARDAINVWNRHREAAEEISRQAARARDELQALVNRLRQEHDDAVRGVANGTYQAAIRAAELDIGLQEKVLEAKKKVLAEAEKVVERLAKELEKIIPIVNDIKNAIDRYNPVTLLIQKWIADIDTAAEEYIKASHRAGLLMLSNSGNPLNEYLEWYACYGQVFKAVPKEVGEVGCLLHKFIDDIKAKYDSVIDGLPEIVRWIVAPTREVQRRVEARVKPELEKATFRIVGFLTDARTAEFLDLLVNPENATRGKLNSVYQRDESGKRLLTFSDVANFVDRDLNLQGGLLQVDHFAALEYAVTLTKLTLLGTDELNRLITDLAGAHPLLPSGGVFPPQSGNFTILFDAVRNIDGNHQWQAYGLPHPRRLGAAHAHPRDLHYGQDGYADPSKGFKIWTERYLREKVFLKLFERSPLGVLSERVELQWPHYRFPSCAQNPFPSTKDKPGKVESEDTTCDNLTSPDRPIADLQTTTASEYAARYFLCGQPLAGLPHWTVAGSYMKEKPTRAAVQSIQLRFPDMAIQVWRPKNKNKYWTIMTAACAPSDRALDARDVAIRRGIARDAFTWKPRLPWEEAAPIPPAPPAINRDRPMSLNVTR
jgi:hypothetical protein